MAVFKLLKKDGTRDERYTFSFRFRGEQFTRRTDATTKEKALALEAAYLKLCRSKSVEEQLTVLKFLKSDESRMRRVCASVGEVKEAYSKSWNQWMGSEGGAMRNVTDLDLVLAYALDLWMVNEGGRKGVKKGARVADVDRINKLSAGVLTDKLVRQYFLARQRAAGLATEAVMMRKHEKHSGFNRTLKHARDLFGEAAKRYAFGGLSLPDLTGFLKEPLLPQDEAKPEPFSMAEFSALCNLFDGLRESEPDLWLLNLIHRQTGLRPRYIMAMRGSWLVFGGEGRCFIEIKDRPKEGFEKKSGKEGGTDDQLVPISLQVQEQILARGDQLTIGAALSKTGRVDLQKRHNQLIKQTVNDVGSHGQGSYRYRDTVACVLGHLYGLEAAQRALGHKTALTTLTHYTKDLADVSDLMRSEIQAWLNLPSIHRRGER